MKTGLERLRLTNFRSYPALDLTLGNSGQPVAFYGPNGVGKTNILEAAYLSGTTKSHKGSRDKEIIKFDTNESHIKTIVVKNEREYQIDIHPNSQ